MASRVLLDFGPRAFQSTDHAMYLVIKNDGRLENAARQIGAHTGGTAQFVRQILRGREE
jgi:hypothetical protein